MESEGSSNLERAGATTPGIVIQDETSTAAATTDLPTTYVAGNPNPAQVSMRMPIATITRIMRRVIPDEARISDEARDAIQDCVSEFIGFITEEAKERCERESRRTLAEDDVLAAMEAFRFRNYVETLSLRRYRAQHYERASKSQLLMARPTDDFARVSPMLTWLVHHHHHRWAHHPLLLMARNILA